MLSLLLVACHEFSGLPEEDILNIIYKCIALLSSKSKCSKELDMIDDAIFCLDSRDHDEVR